MRPCRSYGSQAPSSHPSPMHRMEYQYLGWRHPWTLAPFFLPSYRWQIGRSLQLNHFHSCSAGNRIDNATPYSLSPLYETLLKLKCALPQIGNCCSSDACILLPSLFVSHGVCSYENRVHYPQCKHQSVNVCFSSITLISLLVDGPDQYIHRADVPWHRPFLHLAHCPPRVLIQVLFNDLAEGDAS